MADAVHRIPPPQPYGPAPSARVPRRRIRDLAAVVAEVVRETADTVTLVLGTEEPAEYQAGQFLTVDPHQFAALAESLAYFEEVKRKREPPRAYSMASAPGEPLAFTVKEERYVSGTTRYPPILSPFLVHAVRPGDRMVVTGFTGAYVLPPDVEARTDHLVHLVAGSGIVPNWSILKHALARHPRLRHTVVYSNKTWDDVVFRDALAALAAGHRDRVRVVHALTRDPEAERRGPDVRRGRVNAPLLRELIPDPGACLVYACGPAVSPLDRAAARERGVPPAPRFLEAVLAALGEIGVPGDRVKRESWG
jgi:ferredoxin-NADP reductase